MLTYSIVMTTYNGEKYVAEQLKSLSAQTKSADEVLIFDDGSTDNTVEAVKKFISENNCENWHVFRNETNLGWRRNFMTGFKSATKDVIFCCDQDDVWDAHKCERMLSAMEENENIGVLACNLMPFFEDDVKKYKLAKFNTENYGKSEIEKVKLDKMWMTVQRQGCTMCFRRELLPYIEKAWYSSCGHDSVLWSFGIATGKTYVYNEPFVKFRRHAGTNTPNNGKNSKERSELCLSQAILSERIYAAAVSGFDIPEKDKAYMRKLTAFYKERGEAIEKKRFFKTLSMIKNLNLYISFKGWLADVYSALK